MTKSVAPVLEDLQEAWSRISPHLHRTPVMSSSLLDQLTGANVFFKCEHLQKAGAFKARGATNAVLSLDDETAEAGVATHSSGNHGAALAMATIGLVTAIMSAYGARNGLSRSMTSLIAGSAPFSDASLIAASQSAKYCSSAFSCSLSRGCPL